MSALHGFRHVRRESREFAESQQRLLLREVSGLHVGLTVQSAMSLLWNTAILSTASLRLVHDLKCLYLQVRMRRMVLTL